MAKLKNIREFLIEKFIAVCGITAIVVVLLILIFLLKEALPLFAEYNFLSFLSGEKWYPVSEPPKFGILPLILGSLLVVVIAIFISVPLSVGSAIYIAEIAPTKIRDILKVGIELLAAIPSVVIGFIGLLILAPFIKNIFNLPTGLTALTGGITLAIMAAPTIISITEDALKALPRDYKEASLSLGVSHWQTIYGVLVPAARSGIIAAIMLGLGRVVGETMAVMMITGNAAVIPESIFVPVRTLTATIAAEMGETVAGSPHYQALFAIGCVLFLITFVINLTADIYLQKLKQK